MPVNAPNYQFPEDIPHVSGDRGTGALAVRNDTDAVTTDADGDYTYIATDASGAVKVVPGATPMDVRALNCTTDSISICQLDVFNVAVTGTERDVFGADIVTTRYNQIEIDFSGGIPGAQYISITTSGGGSVTTANGSGIVASGIGANGKALIQSDSVSDYRPGFEMYVWGTASFTTPTDINSFQRIGLYDNNDGYFIGFEGLTFGVTKRSGTVDVQIPQASWNIDTLTGAITSKFTRNGVTEALDVTKINVYRIRFGWFGSAITLFEVLNPDGIWVIFHILRNPNQGTAPHIENPNLPVRIQVDKTGSDATDLVILSGCVAAGTTSDIEEVEKVIKGTSLAKLVKSVLTGRTPGGTYVNVAVNNQGRLFVTNDAIYAEDSGHVSGVNGIFTLGVRNDAHIVLTSTDLDYSPFAVDSDGAIQISDGGNSITIDGTVDTELPAASALADDEANPTVPRVGSMNMVFDGTTWDRLREPTTDAMSVTGLAASPIMGFNGTTWDRLRSVGTGVLLVEQGNASTVSAPAQTATGAAAVVLAANTARRSFSIQNTGTVVVKITLGGTNPTATAYHFALAPGVIADDGRGAFYVDDQWTGDVRAFSSVAGSIVITEIT